MNSVRKKYLSDLIREKSKDCGFFYCGFSKARFLEEEASKLEIWLKNAYHGKMHYMENHFDKRLDPRLLVDDAKSVITLLFNYYPEESTQLSDGSFKISKYAYGEDYHIVIKDKLKQLLNSLKEDIGDFAGRVFIDSAPVMDKVWAKQSGAGWMGKHTNIISPKNGSFFFIAELIIDVELEYDGPIKDYCGTCTRCIDACPTDAIVAPYILDASKCISYLTIELKDAIIPNEFKGKMDDWIFGCDICQDVCPWNRFSRKHNEPRFCAQPTFLSFQNKDWMELSNLVFSELFGKSAIKRTKWEGIKRNIRFIVE